MEGVRAALRQRVGTMVRSLCLEPCSPRQHAWPLSRKPVGGRLSTHRTVCARDGVGAKEAAGPEQSAWNQRVLPDRSPQPTREPSPQTQTPCRGQQHLTRSDLGSAVAATAASFCPSDVPAHSRRGLCVTEPPSCPVAPFQSYSSMPHLSVIPPSPRLGARYSFVERMNKFMRPLRCHIMTAWPLGVNQ